MTRYAMAADLERCIGCQTCTAACRHANATSPAVQWRKVLDIESGRFPEVRRTFLPVGCQHCAEPPCMHVCPTTATRQRADGIVTIDYDLCIGCAYCEVACPYQARFKVDEPALAYGEATPLEEAIQDARRLGVSQKCTFCSDRIDAGRAQGLVPGVDQAATPACVNACIAGALTFGDLHDPASPVSRLLAANPASRMHESLGTEPGFYYLADHRHAPAVARPDPAAPVRGVDIEPVHQRHWDWKAAANFVFGGAGAVLLAASAVASRPAGAMAALALIAAGLGVLFLKIGRPLRFLYVLRQPGRSWMAREAWIAAGLFPLGALYAVTGAPAAGVAAALLACAFLVSQAMILHASRGVPAWRTDAIVPLMLATGAAEGLGLFCLLQPVPVLLVAAVLLRLAAWLFYLKRLEREGGPLRALAVLRSLNPWMLWGASIAPLALLLVSPALAGLAAVAGGWWLKFSLVTRAGYQQGYALPQDDRVVQPGWA